MTIGTIVKKVMSDGWTIIETYIPGKGLNSEDLYCGAPAPSVQMRDKISEQYGAYSVSVRQSQVDNRLPIMRQ